MRFDSAFKVLKVCKTGFSKPQSIILLNASVSSPASVLSHMSYLCL